MNNNLLEILEESQNIITFFEKVQGHKLFIQDFDVNFKHIKNIPSKENQEFITISKYQNKEKEGNEIVVEEFLLNKNDDDIQFQRSLGEFKDYLKHLQYIINANQLLQQDDLNLKKIQGIFAKQIDESKFQFFFLIQNSQGNLNQLLYKYWNNDEVIPIDQIIQIQLDLSQILGEQEKQGYISKNQFQSANIFYTDVPELSLILSKFNLNDSDKQTFDDINLEENEEIKEKVKEEDQKACDEEAQLKKEQKKQTSDADDTDDEFDGKTRVLGVKKKNLNFKKMKNKKLKKQEKQERKKLQAQYPPVNVEEDILRAYKYQAPEQMFNENNNDLEAQVQTALDHFKSSTYQIGLIIVSLCLLRIPKKVNTVQEWRTEIKKLIEKIKDRYIHEEIQKRNTFLYYLSIFLQPDPVIRKTPLQLVKEMKTLQKKIPKRRNWELETDKKYLSIMNSIELEKQHARILKCEKCRKSYDLVPNPQLEYADSDFSCKICSQQSKIGKKCTLCLDCSKEEFGVSYGKVCVKCFESHQKYLDKLKKYNDGLEKQLTEDSKTELLYKFDEINQICEHGCTITRKKMNIYTFLCVLLMFVIPFFGTMYGPIIIFMMRGEYEANYECSEEKIYLLTILEGQRRNYKCVQCPQMKIVFNKHLLKKYRGLKISKHIHFNP